MAERQIEQSQANRLAEAALMAGDVLILPTETVAGFGALASDARAIARLIATKGRAPDKPFAVCVRNLAQAETLGVFDDTSRQLANDNWPGPLTLIMPARPGTGLRPECLGSHEGRETVALRCPDADWRDSLCARPLALTSANRSGKPALEDVSAAAAAFPDLLSVPQRTKGSGAPSTILRVIGGEIAVIRQGAAVIGAPS